MDITTFETAKRLKEAGFPQPDFSTGQLWYNASGALSFIGKKEIAHNGQVFFFCTSVVTARTEQMIPINDGAFFAPTATDILREIHGNFAKMRGYSVTIELSTTDDGFQVDVFEDLPFDAMKPVWEIHENPAEAAASAWLAINEK